MRTVSGAAAAGRASDDELGAVQRGGLFQRVVINQAGALVGAVRHGLEEDGHGRDLLGVSLEPVAQVAAVRQVQAHDAVVRLQQRGVHLQSSAAP